jgi:hypothetical protein
LKFIIAARVFNPKSQGCILLHKIAHTLNKIGHQAAVIFFNGHGSDTQWFISNDRNHFCNEYSYHLISDDQSFHNFKNNAIIIYPEIITGNPLGGKNIVRYMLNREGFIKKGVKINPSKRDFILTHSLNYHEKPDFHLFNYVADLSLNCVDTKIFYERDFDITYLGKGPKYGQCFIVPGSKEITREWPTSKQELANMLRHTRYFYTWDIQSATTADAILCGAFPIFMNHAPVTKNEAYEWVDHGMSVPEITYDETLSLISNNKLNEMNLFIKEANIKFRKPSQDWAANIKLLTEKLKYHFKLY